MTNEDPEILILGDDNVNLKTELAFCYTTKGEELPDFVRRTERDFELIKKFVAKELDADKYMKRSLADTILAKLTLVYKDYGHIAVMRGFLHGAAEPQLLSLGRVLKRWCDDNMPGATPRSFDIPDRPRNHKRRERHASKELQQCLFGRPVHEEPPVLVLTAPEPD